MIRNAVRGWALETTVSRKLRFAFALAVLLAIFATFAGKPRHEGDVLEYAAMAAAIANHGSPDIRPGDVPLARAVADAPYLAQTFDELEAGLRDPKVQWPKPGFERTRDGSAVYSIHFFTYSTAGAVALTAMDVLGLPLGHTFVVVNMVAVFVLGMCLFRLLGTPWRAGAGVLLFMLCGGVLYWNWSSPEIATAASLLGALALFATGAPVAGGLLAGLAASHNPPLVFFAGFGPLFYVLLNYRIGQGIRAALTPLLTLRMIAGVVLCTALALAPPAISMINFGEPSLIAKYSTIPALIGLPRLESFFLDPNQGMIVAVPALAVVLAVFGWRVPERRERRRYVLLLACAAAFTLALALPALSALNWNSGARGVMRYGFWTAMPLLFAFLLYLRAHKAWPGILVGSLVLLQLLVMTNARSYEASEFSPAGHWLLRNAPDWYTPDPEIFFERLVHAELPMDREKTYSYTVDGKIRKTLYNNMGSGIQKLCGAGSAIENRSFDAGYGGWRYFNGEPRCTSSEQMTSEQLIQRRLLGEGWSGFERGGGNWDGAWSNGERSHITLRPPGQRRSAMLTLRGHYYEGNSRTRLEVNGHDFGWVALDRGDAFDIGEALTGKERQIDIVLEHEMPGGPSAPAGDGRKIAYFLRGVELH